VAWGPGTIRFMPKNERYIGRYVWKKRMWVTDPATGARTYRMRGEDEWVTTEQPQLAIVSNDLWERVQARFAERKGAKGRVRGTGATDHLLTALLRCGECGSTMRVVSLKRKAGRAYANFGCSAHHGKGAAICGNGLVISERKLNRAVIDELRKLLASKEIQARFIDGFAKRLQHKNPSDDRERAALEAEVKAQESRVRNVTAAIARSGFSEALAEQLGLEEETLRSLRQRMAAKVPVGDRPAAVPDPDAVARFLEKVLEIAETAPSSCTATRSWGSRRARRSSRLCSCGCVCHSTGVATRIGRCNRSSRGARPTTTSCSPSLTSRSTRRGRGLAARSPHLTRCLRSLGRRGWSRRTEPR